VSQENPPVIEAVKEEALSLLKLFNGMELASQSVGFKSATGS